MFNLSKFITRYICGGPALTECRSVSRKRLLLNQIGLNSDDIQAQLLNHAIGAFNEAVNDFESATQINIDTLLNANSRFFQKGKIFGVIRKTQNWIGESIKNAIYLPPPPEEVKHHLDLLISELKKATFNHEQSLLAYGTLTLIHPFPEGNGRTSRALLQAIINKQGNTIPHIDLYRVGLAPERYREAIQALGLSHKHRVYTEYWGKAESWLLNYQKEAEAEIGKTQSIINQKLAFTNLTPPIRYILAMIFDNPIFTVKQLITPKIVSPYHRDEAIRTLIERNILKPFRTKSAPNLTVFTSMDVMDTWEKLDGKVFKNKELVQF